MLHTHGSLTTSHHPQLIAPKPPSVLARPAPLQKNALLTPSGIHLTTALQMGNGSRSRRRLRGALAKEFSQYPTKSHRLPSPVPALPCVQWISTGCTPHRASTTPADWPLPTTPVALRGTVDAKVVQKHLRLKVGNSNRYWWGDGSRMWRSFPLDPCASCNGFHTCCAWPPPFPGSPGHKLCMRLLCLLAGRCIRLDGLESIDTNTLSSAPPPSIPSLRAPSRPQKTQARQKLLVDPY